MKRPDDRHDGYEMPPSHSEFPSELSEEQAIAILRQLAESANAVPNDTSKQTSTQKRGDSPGAPSGGENQLNLIQARYQALVEQIPAITFMAALDGSSNDIYVSPHIEAMLGFTQEEWLSDPFLWYRQLHPDDRLHWQEEFSKTCSNGTRFKSEYRFMSRENREVWVQGEAKVIRDSAGRPIFLHGVAFDITERKLAENLLLRSRETLEKEVEKRTAELQDNKRDLLLAHQRLSAVVETAVTPIITTDERGVIESANAATSNLFGYSLQEMIGQNIKMLMPEPYKSEHDSYLERYHRTGEARIIGIGREVMGRRRDGTTLPIELSVTEVLVGNERHFTGMIQDLSARNELFHSLEEAKRLAEDANRTKSQFLANMSHELRTPLNAIIGYSELLTDELEDVADRRFVPDLQRIRSAANHLLGVINDILDLSKIEAGKMDVFAEEFLVNEFLKEIIETVRSTFDKNKNKLMLQAQGDLGTSYSDTTKIRQILFNLLSNAAKFTDHGEVTLTAIRMCADGKEWLQVSVRDTGIGMSQEQLGKIFEAFTQAESSTTRRYGGTGLGLTISKCFCEMLGGKLSVESVPGRGSCFTARLLAFYTPKSADE